MLTAWKGPEEARNVVNERYAEIRDYCAKHLFYDHDAACHCTHEVFIVFLEKYQKISPERIPGWLYKTANNVMARYRSSIVKVNEREFHFESEPDNEAILGVTYLLDEPNISDEELDDIMEATLAELDEDEYELYSLIYDQRMPRDKVMELLDVKSAALSMRLFRLKNRIVEIAKTKLKNYENSQT